MEDEGGGAKGGLWNGGGRGYGGAGGRGYGGASEDSFCSFVLWFVEIWFLCVTALLSWTHFGRLGYPGTHKDPPASAS